ncbi:MAG: diguanylate cyclase [Desulfobulbus sp.]|nr:diguanylate cyclase [Desulfobulbus sp.]
MIVQLPVGEECSPEECDILTDLAETVSGALRQLFLLEEVTFKAQELRLAEERYELALHASQAGLWDWNIQTGEMYTSPDQWELLDYRENDEAVDSSRRSIHPDDRERVLQVLNEHLSGATEEYRIEYRVLGEDGELSWFLDRGRVVERDANHMPIRMTGTHQNITLQKRQDQALQAVQQQLHDALDVERNFLQTVIDSAGDPVMVIDLDFTLLLINQAAAHLVRHAGARMDKLTGQKCYHLFCNAAAPCHDERFPCPVLEVRNQQCSVKLTHNPYHGNDVNNTFELEISALRNSRGEIYGIIEVARDVTDYLRIEKELRASQSHLYRLAHHDTLTGLPNRLLFRDRLAKAISMAERNRTGVAVLFLDLDRFKQINDTLGHDVGDELLVTVAGRLQRQCRQSDTVARLGGDEFVFVLEAVNNRNDAAMIAEKILKAVNTPIHVKGHELHVSTSIGVALFPQDSSSLDGVVKCADIALYSAKDVGRSNFQLYTPDIVARSRRPQMGIDQFQEALTSREFRLRYLPQRDLHSKRLVGVKALLQWEHPDMGLLLPNAFLAAADECDMLAPLTRWHLEQVCQAIYFLQSQGISSLPVTVAVTARQLGHSGFFPVLTELMTDYPDAAHELVVEIPDTAMTEIGEQVRDDLVRVADLGVGLAIKGFNEDGCAIACLPKVPLRRLVISRRCLSSIFSDSADGSRSLLDIIVALGQVLKVPVLADGVEQEGQLDLLCSCSCAFGQGSYLGALCTEKELISLCRDPG